MATNLITIDDYKTYKGMNSDNEDPVISLLIGSVSNFVKEYTGRALIDYAYKDKTEYFDSINYNVYYPEEFPLQSVTSLEVSTDGGVTYTALTENTDFFVDLKDDAVISNTGYTGFGLGSIAFKSGKIVYQGGYNTTPADLKLACMDMVHYYRKEDYSISKAMQGASINNPVTILEGSKLPSHIRRIFDLYRVL